MEVNKRLIVDLNAELRLPVVKHNYIIRLDINYVVGPPFPEVSDGS